MADRSSISRIKNPSVDSNEIIDTKNEENKESTALIWYDANIGSDEDTEQTKQKLRHINNYVVFHSDLDECVTFIESISKEKIFLITSGSKASQILPRISSLQQIDSIFIYCIKKEHYEDLINEHAKIIGIYVNLKDLYKSIKEQIYLVNKQLQKFSFFDHKQKSTKDLSKQSAEFLWFQLFNYVITRLPKNQEAKQQMVEMCKQYYRGNIKELRLIDQFDQEYRSEDAIRWYSKQTFVYKLINKALRSEDTDLLYTFRFFITDLSQSLTNEHNKMLSSKNQSLTVYRGGKLDTDEFDRLKENQGKLISTNGYLSTSRCRLEAFEFAMKSTKRTDVIPVLFQIECNIDQADKNVIFADIARLSEYPDEQEVLFDLNACFTIESIEEHESVQIIKMNLSNEGRIITKDYIELIQKETEDKSVSIAFGELMGTLGQYDKSQKYFEQLLKNPNGEDLAWIEFNIGRALQDKGEWKEAREYYDRSYDRMMNSEPPRIKDSAEVLDNIGIILCYQGKHDEPLEYHQRALNIQEKYYSSGHASIAESLNNIGRILSDLGKCDEALDYHQRALKMQEQLYPFGNIDIAESLNNIGLIFSYQGKYDEALDYHQRALKMKAKFYPSGHLNIARSLNNIGLVLSDQGKCDEALDYFYRALKIREQFYRSGHVDIAQSLNNIGLILSDQGKCDEALDYHQRALKMQEQFYLSDHVDIAQSLSNIGLILSDQGKCNEALDYHQRALKMQQEFYPAGHLNIAQSLNNIGLILFDQGKYNEALDYHQQALNMQEKFYPSGHVDIAQSLNNIGIILSEQRKCDEAHGYHLRALQMQEKYYPSGHIDIAESLNNIGLILSDQGKCDDALDYHQRALKMQEKFYPAGHANIAQSLNNIGLIFSGREKYDEALEYHQQALKIQEQYYPSSHADMADSLNNIGICYEYQNKPELALNYYQQALTIYNKFRQIEHPDRGKTEGNTRRLSGIK